MKKTIFKNLALLLLIGFIISSCSNANNKTEEVPFKENRATISKSQKIGNDVIGVWEGSSSFFGITMREMLVFKSDGSGMIKINNESLSFTWRMKDSSIIEAQTNEGTQTFKIVNGHITDIRADGSYGTTYYKQ